MAPRQETTSLLIPRSLFTDGPELTIRVYASSGIATGVAEQIAALDDFRTPDARVTLLGSEPPAQGEPLATFPCRLRRRGRQCRAATPE